MAEEERPISSLIMLAADGQPMKVLRPSLPKLALALARRAVGSKDPMALAKVAARVEGMGGRYSFVGYLSKDGKGRVLDRDGKDLGPSKPGDSYVTVNE